MIKFIICGKKGPLLFLHNCLVFIGFPCEEFLNIVVLNLSCGVLKCASLIALFSLDFDFLTDILETILSSSITNANRIFQRKILPLTLHANFVEYFWDDWYHPCWSVNVVLNLWDGPCASRLLGKRAWACVVMDVSHLITTQIIVIRWIPYKENVPFERSSRWRVCTYGLYVRAIACTRITLYCACSPWSDEWEHREWTASYIPARQVFNTPFQITRSRSSW